MSESATENRKVDHINIVLGENVAAKGVTTGFENYRFEHCALPELSMRAIDMATSLFGISTDVAMQVVAIGFVISVVQDSAETALNSSTDVLLTAAGCPDEYQLP